MSSEYFIQVITIIYLTHFPAYMKDYLRAAWTNTYTRAGYALMASGLALTATDNILLDHVGFMTAFSGVVVGAFTHFGMDTLKHYRRARKNIEEYKCLRTEYKLQHRTICAQAAIKMAEKDLEKIIRDTNHDQHRAS